MRALEQQQEKELLSIPYDPNAPNGNGIQHLAASAPTTPPRVNAVLNGDAFWHEVWASSALPGSRVALSSGRSCGQAKIGYLRTFGQPFP